MYCRGESDATALKRADISSGGCGATVEFIQFDPI
jgi:hypothetical protein